MTGRSGRRLSKWVKRTAAILPMAAFAAFGAATPSSGSTAPQEGGLNLIKHVIIIMQENRSFDSYFGTYPGAAGIPMHDGVPTVCVPNPAGGCVRPYHDTADINGGGPHGEANSVADREPRPDGRLHPAAGQGEVRAAACPTTRRAPAVPACPTSWATTPRRRYRTTGPTPRTSSSRTTCSSR